MAHWNNCLSLQKVCSNWQQIRRDQLTIYTGTCSCPEILDNTLVVTKETEKQNKIQPILVDIIIYKRKIHKET